jgi:hypothetical protein
MRGFVSHVIHMARRRELVATKWQRRGEVVTYRVVMDFASSSRVIPAACITTFCRPSALDDAPSQRR